MISTMCQIIQSAQSFGIITPFKADLSEIENNERLLNLKKIVRSAGFGSIVLIGEFEKNGLTIQEKSIFIPNLKKSTILKWGQLFDQFSVIFKDEQEFVEIGCNKITGFGDVKIDFYKKGWTKDVAFNSELAFDFFTQISKGSHREKVAEVDIKNFSLKEIVPLSFNERAYHGKKNGDEKLLDLLDLKSV